MASGLYFFSYAMLVAFSLLFGKAYPLTIIRFLLSSLLSGFHSVHNRRSVALGSLFEGRWKTAPSAARSEVKLS